MTYLVYPKRGAPLQERFDSKWVPEPNTGCWLWLGGLTSCGYGAFAPVNKGEKAHRWAWMLYRGPIPEGMVIDHMCRVRSCVNPDHLRVVTPTQNTLENSASLQSQNAKKTHCKNNHLLAGDNLYVNKHKDGTEARACRTCKRVSDLTGHRRRRREQGVPFKEEWSSIDGTARKRASRDERRSQEPQTQDTAAGTGGVRSLQLHTNKDA